MRSRSRLLKLISISAVAAVGLAACGSDDNNAATETTAPAEATTAQTTMAPDTSQDGATEESSPGTIVDVATEAGDFTTLVTAVEAAGLAETLSGPGPFTVFAPTDEAFAASLDELGITAEELLADNETLTSILTYHVVPAEVPSSEVMTMDGQTAPTVNGAELSISVDGSTVKVDDANVTAVDIPASNGIIHVIDSVLVPPAN